MLYHVHSTTGSSYHLKHSLTLPEQHSPFEWASMPYAEYTNIKAATGHSKIRRGGAANLTTTPRIKGVSFESSYYPGKR
jgi:hypothetical protein